MLNGKEVNLDKFGVEIEQENSFLIQNKSNQITIKVNSTEILKNLCTKNFREIKGIGFN